MSIWRHWKDETSPELLDALISVQPMAYGPERTYYYCGCIIYDSLMLDLCEEHHMQAVAKDEMTDAVAVIKVARERRESRYQSAEEERQVADKWVPMTPQDAREYIGVGIHTGLRNGTDAPEADHLWCAISDSNRGWGDALDYLLYYMDKQGIALCSKEEQ